MTQQANSPTAPDVSTPTATAPPIKKSSKKRKKKLKRIITLVVVLSILVVGGYFLWKYLFSQEDQQGELLTDYAMISSIQSMVEGSGSARAKDSAAITLSADGVVREVYVSEGEFITAGQPLYTIDSEAAQNNITTAREGVETAKKGVSAAEEGVIVAQEAVTAAEEGISTAEEGVVEAQKTVEKAQSAVDQLLIELDELNESLNDLTVTAPFAGKLTNIKTMKLGDSVPANTTIATLVDNLTMKMSLYFSYAYEDEIQVGQKVQVSIPATMGIYSGTVEAIHKVSRIAPEGAVLFEVIITMENPGTLTEDMEASVSLTAKDGSMIYPYENTKLEYYSTQEITTKLSGSVVSQYLYNYADVAAGQTLLVQGTEEQQKLIDAKNEEIETARDRVETALKGVETARKGVENAIKGVESAKRGVETAQEQVVTAQDNVAEAEKKLAEAIKALDNFNAVSPIDGTVMSCTISPGQEVRSNETVITISNTTSMTVEITVDDRNISFVKPGMMVDLSDYNGNVYMGLVTNINMTPSSDSMSSGTTNYPITLSVENENNTLLSGQWLQYSFVASQSENCIVVPIQSVKSISDDEGNPISVVFIRAEERPENAVTAPEQSSDTIKSFPTEEDGFYAIPVTTGLSDTYNVEILDGLNEGDEVFTNYMVNSANMYW